MPDRRTSDGDTADDFEFGHLIEPDKRELSRTNDFTNDFLILLIARAKPRNHLGPDVAVEITIDPR